MFLLPATSFAFFVFIAPVSFNPEIIEANRILIKKLLQELF